MTPVFIETPSGPNFANVEICRKIAAILLKEKVFPLPFASTVAEMDIVLGSLGAKGVRPGIFVVNMLWADDLVQRLDDIAEDVPILLFRREICQPTASLNKLHQFAEITYGSKTSDEIAAKVAKMLLAFLADGDMDRFERYSQDQLMAVLSDKTEQVGRKTGRYPPIR